MDSDLEPTEQYHAFMSYSHDDGPLATVLRLEIQRFAKPWYRLRSVRIFRDLASMSAGHALWPTIETSLAASRYLILLASPSAAKSPWVRDELKYWLDNKSAETILIALTDGKLEWGAADTGFDTEGTTALPRDLAGRFAVQPRYVDLSWVPTLTAPPANDPRLRDAVADLAAPLLGRPKDEIIGEDVQQHRRLRTWRNAAIAVLSILLVLSATLTAVAVRRGNQLADELAAANATVLGGKALTVAVSDPAAATQFALAAYRSEPTNPQARSALVDRYLAEQSVTAVHAHVTDGVIVAIQQSTSGDTTRIDTAGGTTVRRRDAQEVHWTPPLAPGARSTLSPDGSWLLSHAYDGTHIAWNTRAEFGSVLFAGRSGPVPDHVSAAFSGNSRLVAVVAPHESDDSQVQATIWDLTREPLAAKVAEFPLPYRYDAVNQLAVTDDGASLLVGADVSGPQGLATRADLWRLTASRPPTMTVLPADAAFGPGGAEYYVCTAGFLDGDATTGTVIEAIDTATGVADRTIGLGTNDVCPVRTADGEHVVVDHAVTPPSTSTRAVIVSLQTGRAHDVTVPADSGDLPVAADPVTRWPLADPRISARDLPDGGLVGTMARGDSLYEFSGQFDWVVSARLDDVGSTYVLSDDGRYIVGSGSGGTLTAHDASTGQVLGTVRADPPSEAGMPFDTVDADINLYRLYRTPSSDRAAYAEWSLPDLRPLAHYDLPPAPGFGPPAGAYIATTHDRLYALVGAGRALSVFDRHTHKQIAETVVIGPTGPNAPSDTGRTLLVDPRDPDRLIATSTDGRIVAWSVSRRTETATLPIELSGSGGTTIAFSADGTRLHYIDKNNALQTMGVGDWTPTQPGFAVPQMDDILGVTGDGYIVLGRFNGGAVQFWDLRRGTLSGVLNAPRPGSAVLKGLDREEILTFGQSMMPQRLQTSGQAWFDHLCRINRRSMSQQEKLQIPARVSTDPCGT